MAIGTGLEPVAELCLAAVKEPLIGAGGRSWKFGRPFTHTMLNTKNALSKRSTLLVKPRRWTKSWELNLSRLVLFLGGSFTRSDLYQVFQPFTAA
jgi:hypothetical protein